MSDLPPGFVVRGGNELPEGFVVRSESDSYQPDTIRAGYQGLMNNVAKPINDTISSGIGAVGNFLKDTVAPTPTGFASPEAKKAYSTAGKYVADSPVGVAAKEGIAQIGDAVNDIKSYDANGNLSHDLPAFGQNALLASNLLAAKPLVDRAAPYVKTEVNAFEKASRSLPGIAGDVSSGVEKAAVAPSLSQDALDVGSKLRYESANAAGALIKPEGVNSLVDVAKQKVGYQTAEGQAFAGKNIVTDTLDRLDTLKNKPISLAGLDEIDGRLQSDISIAARAGDKEAVAKLADIRDTLRNARTNVSPDHLVNPQGFEEWRAGDTLFAAKSKMKELQGIIDNAYMTDNPATAMRTGYRNLYKRLQKNPMGYTPDEIAAIGKGARGSLAAGALKTLGGRLMSGVVGGIGGAAGGGIPGAFAGAAIGEGIGYPMRAAANAIQESRVAAPMSMVASRPAVLQAIPQSVSEISKLPMVEQKAALEALFQARKATVQP